MATKKKSDGSGIQQAAGLIRYFDEESEESWKITPAQVYLACIALGGFFYLVNQGVVQAIWNLSLIHITEPTRHYSVSRMPAYA